MYKDSAPKGEFAPKWKFVIHVIQILMNSQCDFCRMLMSLLYLSFLCERAISPLKSYNSFIVQK